MELTKLQSILLPDRKICNEDELYFRRKSVDQFETKPIHDNETKPTHNNEIKSIHNVEFNFVYYDELERKLVFKKYARSKFNTYFNSFSINKWQTYTKISSLQLKLRLKGSFVVRVFSGVLDDKSTIDSRILIEKVEGDGEKIMNIPISTTQNGSIFFELEALEDNCEFHGGEWLTTIEESKINAAKVAIVICTYKREEYIERNITTINERLFANDSSSLKNDLYIYIVDNAKTLDIQKFSSPNIQVIPNMNAGGAGGFTRGILAAKADKDKHGLTHVLLMDDDIQIEPESIARTVNFLKLQKPKYADAFIGGSMMRLDKQHVIHETGARWNHGKFIPVKPNLDVREWQAVLKNEIPEPINYFGWWYCAIPLSTCTDDNLPLPIFIRLDDVEYNIRNIRHGISLNGISVWHRPFERNHTPELLYYYFRNFLITRVSQVSSPRALKVVWMIFVQLVINLLNYDYKQCELILDAIDDFYKGMDWLVSQDPAELHTKISSKATRMREIKELDFPLQLTAFYRSLDFIDRGFGKLIRIITFNGLILPANRISVVTIDVSHQIKRLGSMYRAKRVLQYDITTNQGFVLERSISKTFCILVRFTLTALKLMFTLGRKNNEYREKIPQVRTKDFWVNFLKIPDYKG